MAYAYYSGGADDERLLQGNVDAWSHWQLHPHVLAGVAEVSTATTLLGSPVSSPVAIAPTAIQGLAHPEGEVATARGAAEVGRPADPVVAGHLPRSRTWPRPRPTPPAGCRSTSSANGRAPRSWSTAPPPTATAPWS